MKKNSVLLLCLMLGACGIYAGDYNFMPERNKWVEDFQTWPIAFYDENMQVMKTEVISERDFPDNKVLSAKVGYSVYYDKTFKRIYYGKELLKANMDGGLISVSIPVQYKKGEVTELVGEIYLDNQRYALAKTKESGFVVLVDAQGKLYPKLGQIRDDRLALLNTEFMVYPQDFEFDPVAKTKTEQTPPVQGFDIKYGGIKGDYMTFVYYEYNEGGKNGINDSGEFEVLPYPKTSRLIDLKGVKIKIINVGEDMIEYMVLPN